MPTGENARLEFESGQTVYPMEALTDSGDATIFTSNAVKFSGVAGRAPDVRPNGLATGGTISTAVSGSNDVVDVAALTCYLAGVKTSVTAGIDTAITRPVTNVAKINSITVTSAGAIAVIAGTDGTDANFVAGRGAAGSAPYIPVGSIEIGQIRIASSTAAAITDAQIFQVIGQHQERYDYPLYTINSGDAQIEFYDALPVIHTGDLAKGVFASYADPIFIEQPFAADFVPPENSHSVSSTQYYGATKGSTSSTLNQGSFTALLNDGVTDPLVKVKDEILWFRFAPDKFKLQRIFCQGKLGMARAFPAGSDLKAACTISAALAATGDEG